MTREAIIQKSVSTLSKLPQNKVEEVADFANFLLQQQEDADIRKVTYRAIDESETFDFLYEEEDIYNLSDAKEVFR